VDRSGVDRLGESPCIGCTERGCAVMVAIVCDESGAVGVGAREAVWVCRSSDLSSGRGSVGRSGDSWKLAGLVDRAPEAGYQRVAMRAGLPARAHARAGPTASVSLAKEKILAVQTRRGFHVQPMNS
jgi:hypothetical protein